MRGRGGERGHGVTKGADKRLRGHHPARGSYPHKQHDGASEAETQLNVTPVHDNGAGVAARGRRARVPAVQGSQLDVREDCRCVAPLTPGRGGRARSWPLPPPICQRAYPRVVLRVGGIRPPQTRCCAEMSEAAAAVPRLRAVVTGGTGAIGKYLVGELLSSGVWERITVVGRCAAACHVAPGLMRGSPLPRAGAEWSSRLRLTTCKRLRRRLGGWYKSRWTWGRWGRRQPRLRAQRTPSARWARRGRTLALQ